MNLVLRNNNIPIAAVFVRRNLEKFLAQKGIIAIYEAILYVLSTLNSAMCLGNRNREDFAMIVNLNTKKDNYVKKLAKS